MPVNIKIENYEGPFDLLLHLIKKNEMDIYNIQINEITTQYVEYLKQMKEMDLELTSEFIVIAATLMEIKSKLLLPKSKEKEEKEEEDPQKELIRKLILYKKFKKCAEYLKEIEEKQEFSYDKKAEIIERADEKDNDILKNVTMLQLYNIYSELINKFALKKNVTNVMPKAIPIDKYKIQDKMEELIEIMLHKKNMDFTCIINNCDNKLEAIVTFLALLELIKLKTVKVYQQASFNNIYIERVNK